MGAVSAAARACGLTLFGLAAACEQSPSDAMSTLTGTVLYRERIALPADAVVEVRLEDVSVADVPAPVIAEQTIATNGRQPPIAFELRYAPERIEPNRRYGVRASIRAAGGDLMFTTAEHHPVLTQGGPTADVEIMVQRAGGGATTADEPTGSITGEPWRLVALRRPDGTEVPVAPEPLYTIEFGADGRYSGQAHCNRHMGAYARPAPNEIAISAGAATLAACPEPSIADEYLRTLASVTRYTVRGDELELASDSGALLMFTRAPAQAANAPEVGRTFVFDCEGQVSFTVRTGPGEAAVWAPDSVGGQYVVLGMVESPTGTRYEDGATAFVHDGERATFQIAGRTFADCRANQSKVPWADAKRRGVTFRALGNEPSWVLEIFPDRLALVTDLGARRTELPYAEPLDEGTRTTYRTNGGEIVAVIDRAACTDTMSGEAFDATATVMAEGTTYRGCGRFL